MNKPNQTQEEGFQRSNRSSFWMRLRSVMRLGICLAWIVLAACGGSGGGGGGGGGGVSTVQPFVQATVISFPAEAVPAGFIAQSHNTVAAVMVRNQTESGTSVTNAVVTVNEVQLTYNSQFEEYLGSLNVEPGDNLSIRVVIGGASYSASKRQFSAYPTITDPTGSTTWSSQTDNLISWSGTVPDSAMYALAVFNLAGDIVWPAEDTLRSVPPNQSSYTIPTGSLSTGDFLAVVGLVNTLSMPGTAPGSLIIVGGFNYVPIGVTDNTITPQSLSATPAVSTLGLGKSSQLTATATFSDGSTQDVTAIGTWSSSDPAKVTVSATGMVTGAAFGSATVSVEYAGLSASIAVNVFEPNPSPVPPLSQSVAYQIDYAHSGHATVGQNGPSFPPTATWSVTLNGTVSYPLVADGRIYVTTGTQGSNGTSLYALDENTGQILWGPVALSGSGAWSASAYDHGTVFALGSDGVLRSFDGATGGTGWSKQLVGFGGDSGFGAPPTAVNGIVYVSGLATLFAIDESTGSTLWRERVLYGDKSSPAVSIDGVFVSYPCQVYKFDPLVGTVLWHYSGPCEGGGGSTPVYANNQLFVRDLTQNPPDEVFDATTGTQLGTFPPSTIPVFSGQTGFFLSDGTLSAIDQSTHETLWTFSGDGGLATPPIVINGVVVIGSLHGAVYALDAASGNVIWTGSAPAPISAPDEQDAVQLTGLGAGEGYLVVPAGSTITTWRIAP